jgi:hypothetical protein
MKLLPVSSVAACAPVEATDVGIVVVVGASAGVPAAAVFAAVV